MRHFVLAVPIVMAMSCSAVAQQAPSPDDLEAIGRAATIIREQGASHPLLRDLADQAEAIAGEQRQQSQPLAMPKKGQLTLFVSASMGDEGLKRAFGAASGDPEVTIVFRGALPGETFTQVARRLAVLIEDIDPRPNVAIHPKSFRDHRVASVPTIIEPATGKVIRGTVMAETFRERAEDATETDLGTVGPVSDIVEPDLALLIKERIAEIDVERRAKESVASYWQRAPFIDVPKARERRVRRLDPTVITENDLRDHEGAASRSRRRQDQPARRAALHQPDPDLRRNRSRRASNGRRSHIRPDRTTILITTRIDRDVGWPAWKELHQALGLPVYLLQVQDRRALRPRSDTDHDRSRPRRRDAPDHRGRADRSGEPVMTWRRLILAGLMHLVHARDPSRRPPRRKRTTTTEDAGSVDCPDADGLGASLVNNICWDCIFPIRIAGADISLGDSFVPARAARAPVCVCGNCVGFTVGMWEPARMVELVRGNPHARRL